MEHGKGDNRQHTRILEDMGDAVFEVDTDGLIRYCNDSLCDLTNHNKSELNQLSELFDDSTTENILACFSTSSNEVGSERIEGTLFTNVGHEIPVDIQLAVSESSQCEVRVVGVVRSKEYWNERLRALELYKLILDRAPVGVFITDETGDFVYWNERAYEMYEWDDEIQGVQWTEIVADDDISNVVYAIERLSDSTGPESVVIEHESITKTGRTFPSENYATFIPTNKGVRGVGVVLDVSERDRRKQRLKVMQRLLRHNLRNEMSVILGQAEAIQTQGDEKIQGMAELIVETGTSLLETTERLRTLDKTIENTDDTQVPIDIVPILTKVIDNLQTETSSSIKADLPKKKVVSGSPHIKVAFEEILDNAVTYGVGEETNGKIDIWLDERSTKQRDQIVIHIKDDGTGIPEQDRNVVVGEQSISDLSHSSGLGLWIARWIVEDCGGSLEIEIDDGTEVKLVIPKA